jgi:hypothetical protein
VTAATAPWRHVLAPRIVAPIIGFVAACAPLPAVACILTTSIQTDLGTYSPNAVKAKAVPSLRSVAGLQCDSALLVLLGGNFIRAKFNSANAFKLVRDGGGSIVYKASADPDGTYAFAQGTTIDYMQNNLLNLLGLLGNSSADLPIFVKPDDGTLPPVGVYRDRITINWNWDLCPGGIKLLGVCVGHWNGCLRDRRHAHRHAARRHHLDDLRRDMGSREYDQQPESHSGQPVRRVCDIFEPRYRFFGAGRDRCRHPDAARREDRA